MWQSIAKPCASGYVLSLAGCVYLQEVTGLGDAIYLEPEKFNVKGDSLKCL